jgi:hypothetical protein
VSVIGPWIFYCWLRLLTLIWPVPYTFIWFTAIPQEFSLPPPASDAPGDQQLNHRFVFSAGAVDTSGRCCGSLRNASQFYTERVLRAVSQPSPLLQLACSPTPASPSPPPPPLSTIRASVTPDVPLSPVVFPSTLHRPTTSFHPPTALPSSSAIRAFLQRHLMLRHRMIRLCFPQSDLHEHPCLGCGAHPVLPDSFCTAALPSVPSAIPSADSPAPTNSIFHITYSTDTLLT